MGVREKGPSNTSIQDAFSREGFFFFLIRNMRMSYSHEQHKDLKEEIYHKVYLFQGAGVKGLPSQVEERRCLILLCLTMLAQTLPCSTDLYLEMDFWA